MFLILAATLAVQTPRSTPTWATSSKRCRPGPPLDWRPFSPPTETAASPFVFEADLRTSITQADHGIDGASVNAHSRPHSDPDLGQLPSVLAYALVQGSEGLSNANPVIALALDAASGNTRGAWACDSQVFRTWVRGQAATWSPEEGERFRLTILPALVLLFVNAWLRATTASHPAGDRLGQALPEDPGYPAPTLEYARAPEPAKWTPSARAAYISPSTRPGPTSAGTRRPITGQR